MSLVELFLVTATILFSACLWWYATIPSNSPPGPMGLPFIGSILDVYKQSSYAKKLKAWTRQYGSVYKFYVGKQMIVVLGDYNTIQEALVKQGDAYNARPELHSLVPKEVLGLAIGTSEGELWKIHRRFAVSTLRDLGFGRPIMEQRIKEEAQYLLEAIEANGGNAFDPSTLFVKVFGNILCQVFFGRRFHYNDKELDRLLLLWASRKRENEFSLMTAMALPEGIAKLVASLPRRKHIRQIGIDTLAHIRELSVKAMANFQMDADEPSNYVQAFYAKKHQRKDDCTFTDSQLFATVVNFFAGGIGTPSTTLRWSLFFMAYYPHTQEKVYEEIKKMTGERSVLDYADRTKLPLVEATIMEVQRFTHLEPFRKTVAPSKLCGYDIPVGTIVAPLFVAVINDPEVYPNPETFDPTRFLNAEKKTADVFTQWIPYSTGKRNCPGEPLARMELFILFTALMSKYRFYFASDETTPIALIAQGHFQTPPPFKICAEARPD